jgi:hypothetical protein
MKTKTAKERLKVPSMMLLSCSVQLRMLMGFSFVFGDRKYDVMTNLSSKPETMINNMHKEAEILTGYDMFRGNGGLLVKNSNSKQIAKC